MTPQTPGGGVPGVHLILLDKLMCYSPFLPLYRSGRLVQLTQLIPMTDNTPRIPDSMDMQRLQAMQLVARMKETSDRLGMGFIGGFIAPNGEKFVMTNMDDEDSQALLPDDLR